jgi:hypothetical protein
MLDHLMLIRYTAAERRHRYHRHITPVHWLHQSRPQSQASCARYPDLRVIPLLASANQTSSHPLPHHMTQSRATTPPLPNLRVPPGEARKSIGVSPASDQRRCGRHTREGVSPNLRKRGRGVGLLWSVIYQRSRGMVGEEGRGGVLLRLSGSTTHVGRVGVWVGVWSRRLLPLMDRQASTASTPQNPSTPLQQQPSTQGSRGQKRNSSGQLVSTRNKAQRERVSLP